MSIVTTLGGAKKKRLAGRSATVQPKESRWLRDLKIQTKELCLAYESDPNPDIAKYSARVEKLEAILVKGWPWTKDDALLHVSCCAPVELGLEMFREIKRYRARMNP